MIEQLFKIIQTKYSGLTVEYITVADHESFSNFPDDGGFIIVYNHDGDWIATIRQNILVCYSSTRYYNQIQIAATDPNYLQEINKAIGSGLRQQRQQRIRFLRNASRKT